MKKSAGIILYRNRDNQLEIFLVHPGGPFWKNKDAGAWTIPKGEFTDEEDALEAAKREFKEETGLDVTIGDHIFTSTCTMPLPVIMDSLYVSRGPFGEFKFATIKYTDPAGIKNGYRFVQYVNGVKEPTIFWESDEFTDGQIVIMQLDASADEKDDPRNIKSGDEVTVEMQTLDEPVFLYWYTQ